VIGTQGEQGEELPPPHIPHTVGLDRDGRPIPPDEPGQRRAPFVPVKPRLDLGYWGR